MWCNLHEKHKETADFLRCKGYKGTPPNRLCLPSVTSWEDSSASRGLRRQHHPVKAGQTQPSASRCPPRETILCALRFTYRLLTEMLHVTGHGAQGAPQGKAVLQVRPLQVTLCLCCLLYVARRHEYFLNLTDALLSLFSFSSLCSDCSQKPETLSPWRTQPAFPGGPCACRLQTGSELLSVYGDRGPFRNY